MKYYLSLLSLLPTILFAQTITDISQVGNFITEGGTDQSQISATLDINATEDVEIFLELSGAVNDVEYEYGGYLGLKKFTGNSTSSNIDGTLSAASLYNIRDIIVSNNGVMYLATSNVIRKIEGGNISLLAGDYEFSDYLDGTGSAARFNNIRDIEINNDGDLVILDRYFDGESIIRKVTITGEVTTLAGSTTGGSSDGTGAAASFSNANSITIDGSNIIYVSDQYGQLIRKVTASGVVTTLSKGNNYTNSNVVEIDIDFQNASHLFIANSGELGLVDDAYRIKFIDLNSGQINKTYGTGSSYSQDGNATDIGIGPIYYLKYASTGDTFYYDGQRILKLSSNGYLQAILGDGNGIGTDIEEGIGQDISISVESNLALNEKGDLFFYSGSSNFHGITKTNLAPKVIIPSGNTSGNITFSAIDDEVVLEPNEIVNIGLGDIINASTTLTESFTVTIADNDALDPTVTIALSTENLSEDASGQVTLTASQDLVSGIGTEFNLTISGTANETADYTLSTSTLIIPAGSTSGEIVVIPVNDANVEVIETLSFEITGTTGATGGTGTYTIEIIDDDQPSVIGLEQTGTIVTEGDASEVTLTATIDNAASFDVTVNLDVTTDYLRDLEYDFDNKALISSFENPSNSQVYDVWISADDVIYFVEDYYVKKLEGEIVTIVAGNGNSGAVNSSNPLNAEFNQLTAIVGDENGNLYVAEQSNHTIRKISFSGIVSTFAGKLAESGDEIGAGANARFNQPNALAIDSENNLYVSDAANFKIKKILVDGSVSKFAGSTSGDFYFYNGEKSFPVDSAKFEGIQGLNYSNDALFIADNSYVKIIRDGRIYKTAYLNAVSDIVETISGELIGIQNTDPGRIFRHDFENDQWEVIVGSDLGGFKDGLPSESRIAYARSVNLSKNGDLILSSVAYEPTRFLIRTVQYGPKIVIPAGQTTGTLSFTAKDDETVLEPSKDVSVSFESIENAIQGFTPSSSYDFTIVDNDATEPTLSFEFSRATLNESDTETIELSATQSEFSGVDTEISFTLSGAAEQDVDFSISATTLTIPAGDTTATVSFTVTNDEAVEIIENIIISISAINASYAGEDLTLALVDNDEPTITSLAFDGTTITEGDGGSINLTATLDAASSFDVSVPVSFSDFEEEFEFDFAQNGEVSTVYTKGVNGSANFHGVTSDLDGNIYLCLREFNQIIKYNLSGSAEVFAGSGLEGSTNDLNPLDATFNNPTDIVFDSQGNAYVTDRGNNLIRKIAVDGVVSTFAGQTGQEGDGVDGNGLDATFSNPTGITKDENDNLYVTDSYNKVRKVTTDAIVTTIYGSDASIIDDAGGIAYEKSGLLYVVSQMNSNVHVVNLDGNINVSFSANGAKDVTVDNLGGIFIIGTSQNQVFQLNGTDLVAIAGIFDENNFQDGPAETAKFGSLVGITASKTGNIYVADFQNITNNTLLLRKISKSPQIIIPSGQSTGSITFTAVDDEVLFEEDQEVMLALSDPVNSTFGTGILTSYNFTIVDDDITQVTSITFDGTTLTEGTEETVSLTASVDVLSNQNISIPVNFSGNETDFTFDFDDYLKVTTLTGGTNSSRIDGNLEEARFQNPQDVLVADDGTIYVSETRYIRKITTDGVVSTLAGGCCGLTDGTGTSASFGSIRGMTLDLEGNIIVADNSNNAIRKVTKEGVVTTIAGGTSGFKDGDVSEAQFSNPEDVAVDTQGNIYVADQSNYRIRRIDLEGNVTTIAGTGSYDFRDGPIGTSAIGPVYSLFVDENNNVIFGDRDYNRIRKVSPEGITSTLYGNGNSFGESGGIGSVYQIIKGENGSIYYYDDNSPTIRKIDRNGLVTSLIGDGQSGFENGMGTETRIGGVQGMTFDNKGNLLFTHNTDNNYLIRQVSLSPQINIPANTQSGSITFMAVDDDVVTEPEELVQVTVGNPSNSAYGFTPASSYDFNIVDNDATAPTLSFEFSRATLNESDTETIELSATQNEFSGVDTEISFTLSGAAEQDVDYSISATTLTIPSGDTTAAVSFTVTDDEVVEIIENIIISISAINASYAGEDLSLALIDNDQPTITSLAFDGTTITEGDGGSINLTATLDAASSFDVSIPLSFSDHQSDFSYDYEGYLKVETLNDGSSGINTGFLEGVTTGSYNRGLIQDQFGDIFFHSSGNTIYKLDEDDSVSVFVSGVGTNLRGMDFDLEGNLIVASANSGDNSIYKITPNAEVSKMAGGSSGFQDGNLASALFASPEDVAVDREGNIFVADRNNFRIRKIGLDGTVSTVAGNGNFGFRDGLAGTSEIRSVFALAIDKHNRVIFGDEDNARIRTISVDGMVSTMYGNGNSFENGGIGVPTRLILDSRDNIIYYDQNDYQIRKISAREEITTLVGSGNQGFKDGVGEAATITGVYSLMLDSQGDLLFFDSENVSYLRKIAYSPKITIPANASTGSIAFTAVDDAVVTEPNETVATTLGTPVNASFGFTPASSYDFTIVDNDLDQPEVSFEFSRASFTEDAVDSVFLYAKLSETAGLDVEVQFTISGSAGLDSDYTLSADSIVVLAGDTAAYLTIKPIQDTEVEIIESIIFSVAEVINATTELEDLSLELLDEDQPNVVSIEQLGTQVIEGGVDSVKLVATLDFPTSKDVAIAINLGDEHLGDFDFEYEGKGLVSSFAGTGEFGNSSDQAVASIKEKARFGSIKGLAFDSNGNLYVAENYSIRKIDIQGNVSLFAGDPTSGGFADGDEVTRFTFIEDITIDSQGNLFVVDRENNRIRKITPDGLVSTFVGNGTAGIVDGTGTSAQVHQPYSIAIDESDNLYISDYFGRIIRKITPIGLVTTLAGDQVGANIDGTGQIARFGTAYLTFANERLYFVDVSYNRVGTITLNGLVTTLNTNSPQDPANYNRDGSIEQAGIFDVGSGIQADIDGNVYLFTNGRIRKLDQSSFITTILGNEELEFKEGSGIQASISSVASMAIWNNGNLYLSQGGMDNYRILEFDNTPKISIPAGQTSGEITFFATNDSESNEPNETVTLTVAEIANAINTSGAESFSFDIIDDEFGFTELVNNIPGLSESSIAWADYDRDGDKDVAVMGRSNTEGRVTRIYNNDNGVFSASDIILTRMADGDLAWVDVNNDGYVDLVVTGLSSAGRELIIYVNNAGQSFTPDLDHGITPLGDSQMQWADFDNDGLKDLIISGLTLDNELVAHLYRNIDGEGVFEIDEGFIEQGVLNGEMLAFDIDRDGDNDLLRQGETTSGQLQSNRRYNSLLGSREVFNNTFDFQPLKSSALQAISQGDSSVYIFQMGDDGQNLQFYAYNYTFGKVCCSDRIELIRSELTSIMNSVGQVSKYVEGDIALADANNDGIFDFLISGADVDGNPKLDVWFSVNDSYELQDFNLTGLRESNVEWIDIDEDGDLDIFISGLGAGNEGAQTLLYENNIIEQRKNEAPSSPDNLRLVDLGNGNVRFEWDAAVDDYSKNIGYNLRIGSTPGNAEVLNPSSDFETGYLLIQEQSLTSNNFYETILEPGIYNWAVQAVDDGFKSSDFSENQGFTLTYEWKKLNLGGIVDRNIAGSDDAILEFFDIDQDKDMDILYVDKNAGDLTPNTTRIYVNRLGTYIPLEINGLSNVVGVAIGDLNRDGLNDIAFTIKNGNEFINKIYFPRGTLRNVVLTSNNFNDYFIVVEDSRGLASPEMRIIDLDNNGSNELVIAGLTNEFSDGIPQLYMMGFVRSQGTNQLDYFEDLSEQIAPLKNATYDFGDIDNDMDIDFLVTGFDDDTGINSILYQNRTPITALTRAVFTATEDVFTATINGTSNMIDFDGDGDLDLIFTGTSKTDGDVFELYENRLVDNVASFVNVPLSLDRLRNSKLDLGDFNGDGYADLLYSGLSEGTGNITKLAEFEIASQRYVDSDFDVSNIINAEVEFGDLDGDADLDFMITGANRDDPNASIFEVFLNVRNQSSLFATQTPPAVSQRMVPLSARSTSSYANHITLNTVDEFIENDPPTPPSSLNEPVIEDLGDGLFEVLLTWESGLDDNTPTNGLTYSLKVGSEPGLEDIMSAGANEDGQRLVPEKGNTEHNRRWRLKLREGYYQWAVQSIDASYNGSEFIAGTTIVVGDPTNLAPTASNQTFSLSENPGTDQEIGVIEAVDPENQKLKFEIISGDDDGAFFLNDSTGRLAVAIPALFDFERHESFTLGVRISDIENEFVNIMVTVNLSDQNETNNQPPIILDRTYTIDENSSNGLYVGPMSVTDVDCCGAELRIITGNISDAFLLQSLDLFVNNSKALDFEINPVFLLEVEAYDGQGGLDTATVTINLRDLEEANQAPVISNQNFNIDENASSGTIIGNVVAIDPEGDSFTYSVENEDLTGGVVIDAETGSLSVGIASVFDFEVRTSFNFTVRVTDEMSRSNTAFMTIQINDVDDATNSAPVVADQFFSVDENSAVGTKVGQIVGTDADGDVISYSIIDGNIENTFALSGSGEISIANQSLLDFELKTSFNLEIEGTDGKGGFDRAFVNINILDVDDTNSVPVIVNQTFNIEENSANNAIVGTILASDANGDVLSYTIISGNTNNAFALNATSGVLTVLTSSVLDFETTSTFSLGVEVSDGKGGLASATITINLTDIEENIAPVILDQVFNIAENSAEDALVGTIVATDDNGDALNFSITSGNTDNTFTINASSGDLTVQTSSSLDFETTPQYTLIVEVSDGNLSDQASIQINITNVDEGVDPLGTESFGEMKLYPNPTNGILSIELSKEYLNSRITVSDLTGRRLIEKQVLETTFEIDLSNYPEGTYLLHMKNKVIKITKIGL